MILDQISFLDCLVFLFFLLPQLLLHVNIFELLICIVQALPFFCECLGWDGFSSHAQLLMKS